MKNYVINYSHRNNPLDFIDEAFDSFFRPAFYDEKFDAMKTDIKETAKEAARAQFAQYGMNNIPEEYIDNYATDMLKKKEYIDSFVDRSIDRKLTAVLKNVVKLNEKTATLDEFNKLMQGE